MDQAILGIHHVTAIAGDPQRNVEFYVGLLGLRLVKRTVNFDDPGTYHLYYGDETGHPGTILTFFPWLGAPKGSRGTGQVTVTSFSVPEGSLGYWLNRFKQYDVQFQGPTARFDEEVLTFFDPDGLKLELVANAGAENYTPWKDSPIVPKHAIRGFFGVTMAEDRYRETAALLTETLDFRLIREDGNRFRYESGTGRSGGFTDVLHLPSGQAGRVAVGTVHHVAWRAATQTAQDKWRQRIAEAGLVVTPAIDRKYFHSIYFHEPGGILFEIATDSPGFTLDEPAEELGMHLMLPQRLEPMRAQLERTLPPLNPPSYGEIAASSIHSASDVAAGKG